MTRLVANNCRELRSELEIRRRVMAASHHSFEVPKDQTSPSNTTRLVSLRLINLIKYL